MGSQKLTSRDSNLFLMSSPTFSVSYFLADSSPLIILSGISAPVVMFRTTPWKVLSYCLNFQKVLLSVLRVF